MATGLYAACRAKVDGIQNAYDDLLDQLDGYIALLKEQVAAEESAAAPDKHKLIALTMQMKGAAKMRDDLENLILDDLIRFADRVIRIKHWEDGVFI